ncbi:DUF6343 family protein [Streptomyces sp. ST2-7A]|uniref:DUF6343 family protein n=1 Tax=Streptomyces sp. ST2-7A TaxID=2907214 RepID=UPI001F339EF0|nr:DUF6343 family protein [Streptomyces sp. ST2-7A]MCE7083327.1 DUF6343 family protein [Streptomyces sp. ST2-7A]
MSSPENPDPTGGSRASGPSGRGHGPEGRDPVPRSRSGMIGRRSERAGTEPVNARSALRLRMRLSVIFIPLFVGLTIIFAVWWGTSEPGDMPGPAELSMLTIGAGLLTVLAIINLIVVLRRIRRESGTVEP